MQKPEKPSPDFPLTPHSSGKWCRKIRGLIRYFGRWEDPDGALAEYRAFMAAAGPAAAGDAQAGLSVKDAANGFLEAQKRRQEAGEITERTWVEYRRTLQRCADAWGSKRMLASVGSDEFMAYKDSLGKRWNVVGVGNEITRIKTWLKWLADEGYINPIRFPRDFRKPSAKAARRLRREAGPKLFTAAEIWAIHDESATQLQAMILLGINAGLGNTDCEELPAHAIVGNLLNFPRPKTEMPRLAILWPETLGAINRAAQAVRRQKGPENALPRIFQRRNGRQWTTDDIAKDFRIARCRAGVERGGFYWLRHTFRTVADECGDQPAVNLVMGHVDASMAAVYRETIAVSRLEVVAAHVHHWLFG